MSPEQAKRHFQALLAEISGDPRDLGRRFPDIFAVDDKIREFRLLAEGVPAVPRSLLGQMENDPRFSSNSVTQHLDVLRVYVTTAVRFLDAVIEVTHDEAPGTSMTIMDERAWSLAYRAIKANLVERRRIFRNSASEAAESAARRGTIGGSPYYIELLEVASKELEVRVASAWSIIQRSFRALGSDIAPALANDVEIKLAGLRDEIMNDLVTRVEEARPGIVVVDPAYELDSRWPEILEKSAAEAALQMPQSRPATNSLPTSDLMPDLTKVFVVHGRNEQLRRDFFAFLRSFGLNPLEWAQAVALTGKGSPYIGEILDRAFETAQAIVVLLSGDDEVRLAPALWRDGEPAYERDVMAQARPNVLFEAGMAFGRNADRTILIQVGSVKAFSDIGGRHVIRLDNSAEMRSETVSRLRTAGCELEITGTDWLKTGNFSVDNPSPASVSVEKAAEARIHWVDLNYPIDSGWQEQLEREGYSVRWCTDDKLARRIDLEGWEVVHHTLPSGEVVSLRLRDKPHDQTLLRKKKE